MKERLMYLFDTLVILGILVLAWNVIIMQAIATWSGISIVTIHLNTFGEQYFEAISFPLCGILGIVVLVRAIRRLIKYDNRE